MIRSPGVYENLCGDLMMPALAHSLCVDIIVFNTGRTSAPFYPVSSTVWGGPAMQVKMQKIINVFLSSSSSSMASSWFTRNVC